MTKKIQMLVYVIILAVFDTVIPIPMTALIFIYVIFQKPQWFRDWVEEIYRS
ncbi:hypothetical protein DSCO28_55850 [Desulfosarcina ovata subsp. sediminis]|uniref:Uncharacterized protein n=1 Tax=Desulfosarcina ovata subsp. sediminis TaxID=885957 RepID=A0A5K7ZXP2_9BACT|nr:hypothetical protein [Desulfosarcina ovata]BBO85019.1 hypothetical protein DSCO28_55850 [Desulfosarcina ovata subsp. sediminis]